MTYSIRGAAIAIVLATFAGGLPQAAAQDHGAAEVRTPVRVYIDLDALAREAVAVMPKTRAERGAFITRTDALKAKQDQLTALAYKLANDAASLSASEMASMNADAVRLHGEFRMESAQLAEDHMDDQQQVQVALMDRVQGSIDAYLAANPAIDVVEGFNVSGRRMLVSDNYNITPAVSAMLKAGAGAVAPKGVERPAVVRYANLEGMAYASGAFAAASAGVEALQSEGVREQERIEGEIRGLLRDLEATPNPSQERVNRTAARIKIFEDQRGTSADEFKLAIAQETAAFWAGFRANIAAHVRADPAFAGIDEIELFGLPDEPDTRAVIFGDKRFDITEDLAAAYKLSLGE